MKAKLNDFGIANTVDKTRWKSMKEDYWDVVNASRMGKYLTEKEADFIYPCLKNGMGICLDVGGGSGRFATQFLEERRFIDMDINLSSLKKALKRKLEVIRADAEKIPFKNDTFDCLSAIEVTPYLDVDMFLIEAHRVLKDGGKLLIITLNKKSYKFFCHFLRQKLFDKKDISDYKRTYKEIKEKLEKIGFEIKKMRGFNWIPMGNNANSRFVSFFSVCENLLKLEVLPSISHWIFLFAVKKKPIKYMGEDNDL